MHAMLLSVSHLSPMGALGIWVWAKTSTFGDQQECTPATFPTVFGTNISVTHVVAFRKGSIVVCTRSLPPPFLNLLIIILVGALMVWFVLTFSTT